MQKVIRDGKVAVVTSHIQEWFLEHKNPELVFLPEIVELIEKQQEQFQNAKIGSIQNFVERFEKLRELKEQQSQFIAQIQQLIQDRYQLILDCSDLTIQWVPVGSNFTFVSMFDEHTESAWEQILILNDENILEA